MMKHKKICCSSPGKVLISGGYLVLEQPNFGLVLALSSRFYSSISWFDSNADLDGLMIRVNSPQFSQSFHYLVQLKDSRIQMIHQNEIANVYVAKTIELALLALEERVLQEYIDYAKEHRLQLEIVLQADNSFYSQSDHLKTRNLECNRTNLKSIPKFLPFRKDSQGKAIVKKTGLGSSASLIASLTGTLSVFFGLVADLKSSENLHVVHNLAQICHSIAQGKIGSGFDIAAACYGNHKYKRFSPVLIEKIQLEEQQNTKEQHGNYNNSRHIFLKECLVGSWDYQIKPFSLPNGMCLLMGDRSGGSETVAMVSKVMHWRHHNPNAQTIWSSYVQANEALISLFDDLSVLFHSLSEENRIAVQECTNLPGQEWSKLQTPVAHLLGDLREAFLKIRCLLRAIGEEAGVPIEPKEQQELADFTMSLPGVVLSGVPGAGGHDAIFALVLNQDVANNVEKRWEGWNQTFTRISALDVEAVQQECGIRVEVDSILSN